MDARRSKPPQVGGVAGVVASAKPDDSARSSTPLSEEIAAFADAVADRVLARLAAARPVLEAPMPPVLLTVAQAAAHLGISTNAMQLRIAAHRLPGAVVVRQGRRVFIHRQRLLDALDRKASR